ncbi:general secretion pathway protein G [Mariprofundus micogutta]|uniref:General secretion pathway protein G n=1 Tax=Mariprofundus micogutta TaxID=1921010 RepID=A0A1L8CP74_9PROT|nr:prepilin-type N-terminal cleavage/methylation domain-containing protein [Mariprofundus micogutta]GAV20725.1 general secretion pathway protein G [Mariprofundus micogutta]
MTRFNRGFTLIEMIGALAIISILAAIIVPNLISRVESVSLNAEKTTLKKLAPVLEDFMIRTHSIPSDGPTDPLTLIPTGNWAWALSTQSALPAQQILVNEMGRARQFFIDPNYTLTMPALFPEFVPPAAPPAQAPAGTPPSLYEQGAIPFGGTNRVNLATPAPVVPITSLRVMIVSDLRKAGATPLAALPTALTAASFDAVWNQTIANPMPEKNPVGALPGTGIDTGIVIQRISLDHLFHRVTISSDYTGVAPLPAYQIESFLPQAVLPSRPTAASPPPDLIYELYIMHGTRFATHAHGAIGGLGFLQLIKGPETFQYPGFGLNPAALTFKWQR